MKALVETIGNQMLQDLFGRQQVEAYRPTVVTMTGFLENLRGTKLRVIEELADDASDEALALARNEEELAAAIKALPRPGKTPPAAEAVPAPEPKPEGRKTSKK